MLRMLAIIIPSYVCGALLGTFVFSREKAHLFGALISGAVAAGVLLFLYCSM